METLRFSRKSWHYWLYSRNLFFTRGYRKGAKNLCAYFWSIVGIVAANLFVLGVIALVAIILGRTIWLHPIESLLVTAFIAALLAAVVVFFLLVWFGGNLWDSHQLRKRFDVREDKPNLLFEYVKAKKSKYCPMIEWQD